MLALLSKCKFSAKDTTLCCPPFFVFNRAFENIIKGNAKNKNGDPMRELSKILLRFISLILGIEQFESFPPPLNKDEEKEAFKRMREGDKKARELIIERNLRLVSHIIRKYYSAYQNPDELLSVGSYGLIKAVDSFKSEYGTRFATYGAKCVQNAILS